MRSSNLLFFIITFIVLASGCTATLPPLITAALNSPLPSISPSSSPSSTASVLPSRIRSAKIVFRSGTGVGGSFDQAPPTGTANSPGNGFSPKRIFYPDNTLMASLGPGNTGWPTWIKSFEVGISGPKNSAALNMFCARFADQNEATMKNCKVGIAKTETFCGVPLGQFRISEADCTLDGRTTVGTGSGSDGVYIRTVFDRTVLGANENLLVTIEYSVGTLNPPASNPTNCFNSQTGVLTPEGCTDFVWRIYLKNSTSDTTQPFLLFVPPTFSSILGNANTTISPASGIGVTTKQFILPLAAHPDVTTLQLSRIQSHFPSLDDLTTYCTPSTQPGNSPLCAGLVIYSMTFFRI